jgi:predicted aconitase
MLKLTDYEKKLADGEFGRIKQLAMELQVKYANALGAEKFVEVSSVAGGLGASPFIQEIAEKNGGLEAVFKEFLLNTSDPSPIEPVDTFTLSLINTMDKTCWKQQNVSETDYKWGIECEDFYKKVGINCYYTCAPYLIGTVPLFGQHLAWMESSAISFANSIAGARTNTEGTESAGASAYTGRTPYWGLHLPENRKAKYQINVEIPIQDSYDWGTLGYFAGQMFKEQVGVIHGINESYDISKIKQCTAAAAASGGVEMFHITGKTPEAHTLEFALDNKKPMEVFTYTSKDRQSVREQLCSANSPDIDFVLIGCPNSCIEEVWEIVRLLNGRKLSKNTEMWIFLPEPLRHLAKRQGYDSVLEKAGAKLMSDSCPAVSMVAPDNTRTAVTNSAKQAHYYPGLTNIATYYYSTKYCIEAAVSGKAQDFKL